MRVRKTFKKNGAMVEIQGCFVDNCNRLCTIAPSYDGHSWIFHRANDDCETGCYGGIIKSPRCAMLKMFLEDRELRGVFDGQQVITWNNGTKWTRLKISFDQVRAFRYRPYVSLTWMFISCLIRLKEIVLLKLQPKR